MELGKVFDETKGAYDVAYERIYFFSSKWIRKKEKYANWKTIFVSLIDKFIVSFPKLIFGPKSYRDFRETDPRVPK